MKSKYSVIASIVACIVVFVVLAALTAFAPLIVRYYFSSYRGIEPTAAFMRTILLCFYPCAALGFVSLVALLRMLKRILHKNPFCKQNVTALRLISWCCFGVALITLWGTLWGGYYYFPFLFITPAAGFMGLILRVVKNVMQSATELREDTDLTI